MRTFFEVYANCLSRTCLRGIAYGAILATAGVASTSSRVMAAEPAPTQPPALLVETVPMQSPVPATIRTLDDLAGLTAGQLEALYRQSGPGPVPTGKVRGLALYPDARYPRAKSRAARVAWQGKVFDPSTGTATNRFFGVRMIQGTVYSGQSWLDGGAAMILDYQNTSKIYGNYRDEIRQVAPGLYLGLMYDRTINPPGFKMYFAFADQ